MVMKEADEELALFLEMRRRENEIEGNGIGLPPGSDKADAPTGRGFNSLSSPMLKTLSMDRKMGPDELFNLGNDKNDLLWLLSPPGSPLLSTPKTEERNPLTSQILNSARPVVLTSPVEKVKPDPAPKKPTESKHSSLPHNSKSSSNSSKRSSLSGPLLSANRRASTPTARPMVPATNKPSRSSTPSRVAVRPSCTKSAGQSTPRSSTPNRVTTARSSTPSRRCSSPAPKTISKPSVPNIRSSIQSITHIVGAPKGQARSSSAIKSRVAVSRTAMLPSSTTAPTSDSRPTKPSGGSSPPTDSRSLKSSLPRRPVSASRVRPSAPASDKSFPPIKSRRPLNDNDEVNPVIMGTKMVERIVNMRKLAPPMQDAHLGPHENLCGKHSLSMASSGFGRSLSKKSLDMAMRHMDITGSKPGKLNRLRSGPMKSSNTGVSDSPLATSSNASSDLVSLNSNSTSVDGSETEDNDLGTERVCPVIVQGR